MGYDLPHKEEAVYNVHFLPKFHMLQIKFPEKEKKVRQYLGNIH